MPRRPVRWLPPPNDPRYQYLLVSRRGEKLIRKEAGKLAKNLPEPKGVREAILWRLWGEIQRAKKDVHEERFSSEEKSALVSIAKQEFRKMALSKKTAAVFHASLEHMSSVGDILVLVQALSAMKSILPISNGSAEHAQTVLTDLLVVDFCYKNLNAQGIRSSIPHVWRVFGEIEQARLINRRDTNYGYLIEALVEKRILEEQKKERMKRGRNIHGTMKKVRRALSRYVLPKTERKKIYSEARERLLRGENAVRDWIVTKRGFKQARLWLRHTLQDWGMNPEHVFASLQVNDTPRGVKRLKLLMHILRTVNDPKMTRETIERLIAKKTASPPEIQSVAKKPEEKRRKPESGVPIIPKSRRESEERKKVKEKPVEQPRKVELPHTLGGYLSLFNREKFLTPEMVTGLNKLLNQTDPRKESKEALNRAMEHVVLAELATHYQKSGRVSETALRRVTTPARLFPNFEAALQNLRKKGWIGYEMHKGESHFISITDAAWGEIEVKYNTRRAMQRRGA